MNPMHAAYVLGFEKKAGIGAFLARGLKGFGKGIAGLGLNMVGSEIGDRFFEKSPEVKKVFVHPGIFQRMQAAQMKGEDPKDIVGRFMNAPARRQMPMLPPSMMKGTGAPFAQPWLNAKG